MCLLFSPKAFCFVFENKMLLPKVPQHASMVKRCLHLSATQMARNIKPYNVGLEGQYRVARDKKVLKVELPDFDDIRGKTKLSAEEYISRIKEKGVAPPRKYKEKPISITCVQGVLDPYVPPEGDGKFSTLSQGGVKQKAYQAKQKGSTLLAVRKIRSYEDEFDVPIFAEQALKIYTKVHELLATNADEELLNYVTEYAYPLMKFQTKGKTIKWQFIQSNEPPSVVQARTQSMIEKNNMFAQVTVRLNTRQILAIYDRFGHLMHGSDAIVKDVLEFVVFEKNISDYNGRWRLHSKIIPDWLPKKEPVRQTFIRDPEPEPPTEEEQRFFTEGVLSDEKKEDEKKEIEAKQA